jgi:hypothetical protein
MSVYLGTQRRTLDQRTISHLPSIGIIYHVPNASTHTDAPSPTLHIPHSANAYAYANTTATTPTSPTTSPAFPTPTTTTTATASTSPNPSAPHPPSRAGRSENALHTLLLDRSTPPPPTHRSTDPPTHTPQHSKSSHHILPRLARTIAQDMRAVLWCESAGPSGYTGESDGCGGHVSNLLPELSDTTFTPIRFS